MKIELLDKHHLFTISKTNDYIMGNIQQPCTKMSTLLFPQRKIVQQLSELKAVRFVESL